MTNDSTKIPVWFWVVTGILLLWNIMGVGSFYYHLSMTGEALEALPLNEQELYGQYPMWTQIVFALAVLSGFVGSVLVLFKKKSARPMFVLSLICIIIQMSHSLFLTDSMDVYGPTSVIMPIILILIGVFAIWWAKYGTANSWLK